MSTCLPAVAAVQRTTCAAWVIRMRHTVKIGSATETLSKSCLAYLAHRQMQIVRLKSRGKTSLISKLTQIHAHAHTRLVWHVKRARVHATCPRQLFLFRERVILFLRSARTWCTFSRPVRRKGTARRTATHTRGTFDIYVGTSNAWRCVLCLWRKKKHLYRRTSNYQSAHIHRV